MKLISKHAPITSHQGEFETKATVDHPYPCTKVMWIPDKVGNQPDLLATTGDYLRLWEVSGNEMKQKALLNNVSTKKCWQSAFVSMNAYVI